MNRKKGTKLPKKLLENMLEKMMIGRKFEEKVQWLFAQGLVHGTTHLGIGEEATGVGSVLALNDEDYMFATHRGHCQAIAKGVDLDKMMAEILAKSTGVCKGRGGSMHIADFDKGILGANGILGASGPLACGAAMTAKFREEDRVCLCFFGEGAANEGAVHEAMNLAGVWELPVMFVLINNNYGMSTPLNKATKETDLTKRAIPYGMKSYEVDGNDVVAVYETVKQARKYCKENGPVLVIENTYRISGHSKSDGNLYRSKDEIAEWKAKCPIKRFTKQLLEEKLLTQKEIDAIDSKTAEAIEKAVEYGKSSPEPLVKDILNDVYA